MGLQWTPERAELLRALLMVKKLSARVAAIELGVSKNAVVGKARKLGIPIQSRIVGRQRRVESSRLRRHRLSRQAVATLFEAPEPRMLDIVALKRRDCRFAVTDDKPFLFCGHPAQKGSPYCWHHHRICYVRPQ